VIVDYPIDHIGSTGRHGESDRVGHALRTGRIGDGITETHHTVHHGETHRRRGDDQNADLTRISGRCHSSS
jgi:hypothetical protein